MTNVGKYLRPNFGSGQTAAEELLRLDSFVRDSDLDLSDVKLIVEPDDQLIGIYFNSADDFIAFTIRSLIWFSDPVLLQLSFKNMVGITFVDSDDRTLIVQMDDGSNVPLPILNDSGEERDIDKVYEVLASIAYWPLCEDQAKQITAITCREDLIQHLLNHKSVKMAHHRQISALRGDFPSLWQLQQFGITPDTLNHPDVWRILAAFLSIAEPINPPDH